jgi:hypothetical protein
VIWHKGISPDAQVSLPANTAPLVPPTIQAMTWQDLQTGGDAQLLKGLELLGAAAGKPAP